MDLQDIKNWLDESIDFFGEVVAKDGCRRDIQENIQSNRSLFGIVYRKREEIKAWVTINKPNALPYLTTLYEWMVDWSSYFQEAYIPLSGETIDTLGGKILERLVFIREKIESL